MHSLRITLSLWLPIIKQRYCLKDSKTVMLFQFSLDADVILVKVNVRKSNWEADFSMTSAPAQVIVEGVQDTSGNIQQLSERGSEPGGKGTIVICTSKKNKEKQIFRVIKNKFPKSIWTSQMFSMWMTHQLYAKIPCCYFKTKISALTFLYVAQRSIVFLIIIYHFSF